jgi:hypothetical protein
VLTLELGLAVTILARFDEITIDPTVLAVAAGGPAQHRPRHRPRLALAATAPRLLG